MKLTNLKPAGLALAAALALAGQAARADVALDVLVDFDNVASGATANSALGALASSFHFANAGTVQDEDANGYLDTFHWVDATAEFGDVLAKNNGYAVSPSNVLWNAGAPILLVFSGGPVDLASFSIQQDMSTFGNPQENGSYLAFLDATGHEIAGANVYYTEGQPGLLIQSGPVLGVSAVLLSSVKGYDNLKFTTAAAVVPEPSTWALLAGGAGLMAWAVRRKRA